MSGVGRGVVGAWDKEARDDMADVQMSPRAKSRRSPLRVAPRQVSTPADAALRAPPAPPGRPAPPAATARHRHAQAQPAAPGRYRARDQLPWSTGRANRVRPFLFSSRGLSFSSSGSTRGDKHVPAGSGPTSALGDPLARGGAPPTEIRGVVFRTRSHETAWDLAPPLRCWVCYYF